MTSRQRLEATLKHEQPDRVCVDFGGSMTSGIAAAAVARLEKALLGRKGYRVKVTEPYQMLGEIDAELREALGIDVVGVFGPKTLFGFANAGWKPFTLFDGTEVLVPGGFNYTVADNGDLLIHPEGDTSAPPSGRMPKGGFYFDSIVRQGPIDEARLDPADNLEEFAPLSEAEVAHFVAAADRAAETGCGALMSVPGTAFGDIALVPAPWMKNPKGIRDIEEWYVSTVARRDYVYEVFQRQCEIALCNLGRLADAVGDRVGAVFMTGTDFGTQRAPFISTEAYRDLYKPFHKRLNDFVHEHTTWKTFIHSCGSVFALIEEFIEAGFDILNPVQCSAAEMGERRLKEMFGDRLVFWGGGVDTQKTLPFGSPREVYDEVRARIDVFNAGGGFVFNAVHNIQANTPLKNMLAMFDAIRDSAG